MESKIDYSTLDSLFQFLGDSPVMPLLKYKLMDNLALSIAIFIDHPEQFDEDALIEYQLKVRSIFSSFDLSNMNELMAIEFCTEMLKIKVSMKKWPDGQRIYEEREKFYCPSRYGRFDDKLSYYPSTGQAVFIYHLLENLEELATEIATSNRPLNHVISRLQRQLHFFVPHFLEITSESPTYLKEIVAEITDLAHEVEYAVDLFLVEDIPSSHCIFWLLKILKKFTKVDTERKDGEDDVVDLEAKKTMIKDMLLGGDERLNVVSISGKSGIGKATFAKELFDSPPVVNHFDVRLQCRVRYSYNQKALLLELLDHLVDLTDIIRSKNDEELINLLYKCLDGKKFLVVIINMDSVVVWNDLRRCFPDSRNGSKIVFTAPGWKLAFQAKSEIEVQPIGERTWGILRESVFQKESCPPQILKVGMKIANRCKYYSISTVISLLKTYTKTVKWWEEIANTLGSYMLGDGSLQHSRILKLSCEYLPDYLKPCFLYLVVFLDEKTILVSKLIQLWIAEGFVKHTASQSLEETGEGYVANLMALNLLQPFEEKSIGGPKICHINSLIDFSLFDFVQRDNFMHIIDRSRIFSSSSTPVISNRRCRCSYSKRDEFINRKHVSPLLQSLLFSAFTRWDKHTPGLSYSDGSISFIFENFKLLRILNLDDIVVGDSFMKVGVLVLLRYLAVQSTVDFIPPSIANLWNLQTFHFKGYNSEVVKVPDSIWDMEKLRHLHINESASFDIEPHRLEKHSSILDNLQTFSTPSLAYGDDMEKMLRRVAGILKLKCIFLDSWDDTTNCNQFTVLEFLHQLISLKVSYNGEGKYPCQFNFPANLKKLTLSKFGMPWSEIAQIAMLCNLEVLKLVNDAVEGEMWEMGDDVVFLNLKFLKLESIDVVEWSATRNHFPSLERLLLHKCEKLVEIPPDFAYINTMRRIEVLECNTSVENSAKLIKEKHIKHWGKDKLKIHADRAEMIRLRFCWSPPISGINEDEYP